jgi:hypothetical protein
MLDRLVTVATFQDPVAAALAKNYLEDQGIPACLMDEATVATDWLLSNAIGGIKLQVDPFHVERAELLLGQLHPDDDEAPAEPATAPTAIATRETAEELQDEHADKEPGNLLADQMYRSAIFGLILVPLQLYTLYLLGSLYLSEGKVSPGRRWKVWVSVLLNMPLMSVVALPLMWLLPILMPGPGSPDNPVWRPHRYTDYGFTVRFPHEPVLTMHVEETDAGKTRTRVMDAWSRQRSFSVMITPLLNRPDDIPIDAWLHDGVASRAAFLKGKILSESAIQLKEITGREYLIDAGKFQERGRTFLRDQSFFMVTVVSNKADCFDAEAEQFFNSFRFLKP